MLIIHGFYRFKQTRIGVRKDFCNLCEKEVVTEKWRSFDMGHLFFIPLLPLGVRTYWRCTNCGVIDPRARRKNSPVLMAIAKGFFALLFLYLTVSTWRITTSPGDPLGLIWGLRLGFLLAAAAIIYFGFIRKKADEDDVMNDGRRRAVVPLGTDTCLYCHQPLEQSPYPFCPRCKVQVCSPTDK